ncbi:hypothetical protein, partial [Methylobacterium sp. WL103]|uniref:hypothetical protein n=1 Tax=Methylobacterium sp. WL103 TaxID=2603891 RepID=UPI00164EE6A5
MSGIRLSRFYNDPNIGKGFENLAGAFAPPDATDMLAGQKAVELRDKGARLAELYANPSDPNYDRRATLLGLQTGASSLEAVGLNNATTRATNAADNARALATNANTTRGSTIASLYGALSPGQIRPAVPDTIAGTIGLPPVAEARGADPAETEATLKAKILGGLPPAEQRASVLGSVPTENIATPQGPRIAFRPDAVGQ